MAYKCLAGWHRILFLSTIMAGRVFTSGFPGRLESDKRKSRENTCFTTHLKLSQSANFSGILIKFKPLNQVASASWSLL